MSRLAVVRRRLVLPTALLGVIGVLGMGINAWRGPGVTTVAALPGVEDKAAALAPAESSPTPVMPTQEQAAVQQTESPPPPDQRKDVFAVRTWQPPAPANRPNAPPPTPVIVAPRSPTASVPPFRFLARIVDTDSGQPTFVLARDASVLLVRVGEQLDASYQLVAHEPGRLIFLHQPMNTRQTLPIGPTP